MRTSVIYLCSLDATSFSCFILPVFGDPAPSPGVATALSTRVERALLDWILANSRLCVVRMDGSEQVNSSLSKTRYLLIVSLYAPIDCGSHEAKAEFH